MKKLFLATVLLFWPLSASAHASPIQFTPAAGARLATPPKEVSITFSERIEGAASSLSVYRPGAPSPENLQAHVNEIHPNDLVSAFPFSEEGTYTLLWSVVSRDDGHFTKGAYTIQVGTKMSRSAGITAVSSFEIVHSSTAKEGATLWLELLGQAMLVAYLGFLLADDTLLSAVADKRKKQYLAAATALILLGTGAYLFLKSADLAAVQGKTLTAAFGIFVGTVAGIHSVVRGVLAIGAFVAGRATLRKWRPAPKIVFLVSILGMALSRAAVSHAAASAFHPLFSVGINWIHLVFKDLWIGGPILLLALFRKEAAALWSQALLIFNRLALLAFVVGGVSGTYIIWLHLKGFEYIAATDWGVLFLQLSLLAGVLFLLRVYGMLFALPRTLGSEDTVLFEQSLDMYALVAECLTGLVVLYVTSVLIITTPPLLPRSSWSERQTSNGVALTLSADPYEEGNLLLEEKIEQKDLLDGEPTVLLQNREEGIGPVAVTLEKRALHRYIFPEAVFAPAGNWLVFVAHKQKGAYDATAEFSVHTPSDFAPATLPLLHDQGFFEATLTLAILSILILGYFGLRHLRAIKRGEGISRPQIALPVWLRSFLFVGSITGLVSLVGFFVADSAFHRECEKNGHYWHLSLPMRAGVAMDSRAVYGCTFGEGTTLFHFADSDEYHFYRNVSPPVAHVDIVGRSTKIPSVITISLNDRASKPIADLDISHERVMHIVVLSEDGMSFAHLHPEDAPKQIGEAGLYRVAYLFPREGRYLVGYSYQYRGTPYSGSVPVEIGSARAPLAHSPDTEVTTLSGTTVHLAHAPLAHGRQERFTFFFSEHGSPVTDLEPYLGAAGHISVAKEDLSFFAHTHAVPSVPWYAFWGTTHLHAGALPDQFGPSVDVNLLFPTPGFYQLFGEFKRKTGEMLTVQYVVEVR